MSEADSPNDQPASASIDPSEQPSAVQAAAEAGEPAAEEGWETVDFPGAISIDALPHSRAVPHTQLIAFGEAIEPGIIRYSSAEIDPATVPLTAGASESPDAAKQLQRLQEENVALRDRLTQAELDLVQHQIEWQLESARSQTEATIDGLIESAASASTGQPLPVELTHDRLNQLLQELERSQQTVQRQQILVETLTEQLASSQERIAQLERDCALTQQRHNEQMQQVLQAESACRDLRLRLHRQQQQTLQFKAALEKCLEMPTVYSSQIPPEVSLGDGTIDPHPLAALLKPKNQPVKPWSQASELTQTAAVEQPARPKPLFHLLNDNLLNDDLGEQSHAVLQPDSDVLLTAFDLPFQGDHQEHTIADSADPSDLLDSDDPQFVAHLMRLMFPNAAEEQSDPGSDALEVDVSQAESIFDLSPFLGAEHPVDMLPSGADAWQPSVSPERLNEPTTPGDEGNYSMPAAGVLAEATALDPTPLDTPCADPLWHDLDAFIAPSSIAPSPVGTTAVEDACADTPVDPVQVTSDRGGIPPFSAAAHVVLPPVVASVTTSSDDQSAQPINAWTWRDRLSRPDKSPLVPMDERSSTEKLGSDETGTDETGTDETGTDETGTDEISSNVAVRTAQRPSKLFALNLLDQRPAVEQPVTGSSQTKPAPASFATATPSPIVYPLRSSKKLSSLAAVDLPTFPKR